MCSLCFLPERKFFVTRTFVTKEVITWRLNHPLGINRKKSQEAVDAYCLTKQENR